jgi:hypothetical protein
VAKKRNGAPGWLDRNAVELVLPSFDDGKEWNCQTYYRMMNQREDRAVLSR